MIEPFWWLFTLFLMLIGVVGTLIPLLPGTTLVLAAVVLHRFVFSPGTSIGWVSIAVLVILYGLSVFVDITSSAVGAKRFGASRLAMVGSVVGALLGIFFGPIGIIAGPLGGALIGEVIAQRSRQDLPKTMKVGYGTVVGTLVGIIGRMGIAVMMVTVFIAGSVFRF
jgi:uncharacterized protein YqgC (DUF456 family)